MRQHRQDAVHFVGERLVQHANVELVARSELIELREQLRRRKAAMARKHRVGGRAAHRQRACFHMARTHLQHGFFHRVIDRHGDIKVWDGEIPHHAIAVEVQQAVVLLSQRLAEMPETSMLPSVGCTPANAATLLL